MPSTTKADGGAPSSIHAASLDPGDFCFIVESTLPIMNTRIALAFALLAAPALVAEEACCAAPAPTTASAAVSAPSSEPAPAPSAGHPLRGVIVAVLPEKSALLVKHEEIPGVMAAMTMLLKVDAATLAAAKKDQAITATLRKKSDGWWLENVVPASPAAE